MSSAPCSALREPNPRSTPNRNRQVPANPFTCEPAPPRSSNRAGSTAVLGPTEILPPVAAVSKYLARLCRPRRHSSRAHPREKPGFSTYESDLGRETDSPLEGGGFEPSVPREIGRGFEPSPVPGRTAAKPRGALRRSGEAGCRTHSALEEGLRSLAWSEGRPGAKRRYSWRRGSPNANPGRARPYRPLRRWRLFGCGALGVVARVEAALHLGQRALTPPSP